MQQLLLEPGNPYDITQEDLEELRRQLTAQLDGVEIAVAYYPPKGAGVTLDEVLHIWLPGWEFLRDEGYSILLGAAIESMRQRFTRRHGAKRRKVIVIHDPDGGEVETITLKDPDSAEEHESGRPNEKRPRPPALD
jgi:hypothetical protein